MIRRWRGLSLISRGGSLPINSSIVSESGAAGGASRSSAIDSAAHDRSESRARGLVVAGTSALAAAVFFFHLGRYGLWEPDEARYAEIAREVVESGNLLLPHLNYVLYLEKPPLLYWLTAASFRLFGQSEFAARFFVAAFAVAGVAATSYFAARAFGRRHAILAGAILATTPLYAVMAQVLTTDMLLAALVTVAMFSLYLHWLEGGAWCWLGYIAIALGILTKGPVAAALPILTVAIFLAWQRELRGAVRRFHAVAGLALVAIAAAPWFIATSLRVAGFFDFYFAGEHFRRIFEPSYSHGEPIWFYLPVLAAGLLPWSMLVPLFTWRAMTPNPARRFCLAASAVVIGSFSLASAKLIPYVLPAAAPIAVLIADGIISCAWPARAGEPGLRPPDSRILAEAGPLLGLLGAGAIAAAASAGRFHSPYVIEVRPALYAVGAIMAVGGAVTLAAFMMRRTRAVLAAIVVAMAAALAAGTWARIEAEPLRCYAGLGRSLSERAPNATVICYHRYVQSLPFYTRRRVILVGPQSELRFGAERAPDAGDYFFKSDAELLRLWDEPGEKVLVIDEPDLGRLGARLGNFAIIGAEHQKRAILKRNERVTSN